MIPHYLKISIHVPQAKLHVNRMWEFDSASKLQKGHIACWVSMIPIFKRMSPIFSFSIFANQRVNLALGGIKFFQIIFIIELERIGSEEVYTLSTMHFKG